MTVVVDDGSGDGTAELGRSLGAHVIEKPKNEGLAAARDDAVRLAEGAEWVAFLDDDDEWLPDHLATLWSNRGDHVIVAGTSVTKGGDMPRAHGSRWDRPEVVRSPARLVFPDNSFTTSATMVRRDVLMAAGGFDHSLRYLEDFDAWLRVLEHGTGLLLSQVTCVYSVHEGQTSNNRLAMTDACATVMAKYAGRPWLTPRVRQGVRVVETWDDLQAARRQGDWRVALGKCGWLLASPKRLMDLVKLWSFRREVRHRHLGAAAVQSALSRPGLSGTTSDATGAAGEGA
jgi:glycosyltransferase involved in cell wall biosynthesis